MAGLKKDPFTVSAPSLTLTATYVAESAGPAWRTIKPAVRILRYVKISYTSRGQRWHFTPVEIELYSRVSNAHRQLDEVTPVAN